MHALLEVTGKHVPESHACQRAASADDCLRPRGPLEIVGDLCLAVGYVYKVFVNIYFSFFVIKLLLWS